MASLYDVKPRFQALLRPQVLWLHARGATANQVTLAAFALSLAQGLAMAAWPGATAVLVCLPLVLLVRMALNAVDGMLAREHAQASPLGALLNETCDMLSDAALYLPLGLIPGVDGPLLATAVVLAVVTEGVGLAALQIGAPRGYQGPMGKSDRALAYSAIALVIASGLATNHQINIAIAVVLGLTGATVLNRIAKALQQARSRRS